MPSRLAAAFLVTVALAAGCGSAGHVGGDAESEVGTGEEDYSSCVWEATPSVVTPGVMLTGNNSADLTGAFLGTAALDSSLQRKKLERKVDNLAPGLTMGDAYLFRLTPTAESAYLVVSLKNTGQDDLCYIKATAYRWLTADGTALGMPSPSDSLYVNGAVRATSALVYADSCLGPGESGTFTDVKVPADGAMLYTQVTAVGMDLPGPFSAAGSLPPGKLIPTGYEVGNCHGQRSVKVALMNSGTADVTLEKFNLSPAIMLDEGGIPTGWMFLEVPSKVTVPGGGTGAIYASLFMEPRVRRLQIYVDFSPASP